MNIQRYDNYKDSGVEWIGQIPNHWNIKTVKCGFNRIKVKANLLNPVILSLTSNGIRIRDISDNKGQIAKSYLEYNVVTQGDLLLNPMDLVTNAFSAVSQTNGVISPAYINLRTKKGYFANYFDYYFKLQYWNLTFFAFGKGVSTENRWTLNNQTLMNYFVPYPRLSEQQQIANFLDRKTAQIDEAISQKEKMIELLKEYRQVTINNAVTKGLDPNVELKDSGIEWLGQIPSHWEIKKLKYFGSVYTGITDKSGSDFSKYKISKFKPYIPFTNICNNFVINIHDMHYVNIKDNENQNIVRHSDLLFLMSSETLDDIGKSAVYLGSQEVYLNSFCKGFQFKEKNNAKYVNYLLNSNSYRTYFSLYGRGFTRINIKQEYINNVHIIEIKSHEQQQIANFLDKKTAQIDEAINLKKSEITKLKEYKATLIDSAVTGKIKV